MCECVSVCVREFLMLFIRMFVQILDQGVQFVQEHGKTILVSTSVFLVLQLFTTAIHPRAAAPDTQAVTKNEPTPKWGLLRFMNYVVLITFIGSIVYTSVNYAALSHNANPLFLFISMIWVMCIAYFFGFFGISLLDQDIHSTLVKDPSALGLADAQHEVEQVKKQQQQQQQKSSKQPASIPKPMNDAPICSERPANAPLPAAPKVDDESDFTTFTNEEVLAMILDGSMKDHMLEKKLGDTERAVAVRRMLYERTLDRPLDLIPYTGYDYDKVFGANCEIVVGYVPLPVGIVGPLMMNNEPVYVPMATTEGCLVASTNRGCKAISASGGCDVLVLKDAITRAPCLRFPSAMQAGAMKKWMEVPEHYRLIEQGFNSTTNYGKLKSCEATVAGRNVYLRFACMSGDAMGMNMVSKGCLKAIDILQQEFPEMVLVAISGNYCTDKKPSAVNWILGRGKSIVCEATIPESVVKSVLKTSVHEIIESNKQKNHIGSAMAGSIGGFNAHAANIVTAVFLATGQDPAQNVESSNCLTIMEYADDGKSLHVSVTMPSVEVGTVGGGTHLPAQAGCLEICGVRGASRVNPGDNARQLAMIVGASVLAGELSLMAALAANHLVRSHMQHNRKPQASTTEPDAAVRKNASMPEISK
jgi:hydroxymethylglutaryl-CoA reductase (NADPH)